MMILRMLTPGLFGALLRAEEWLEGKDCHSSPIYDPYLDWLIDPSSCSPQEWDRADITVGTDICSE